MTSSELIKQIKKQVAIAAYSDDKDSILRKLA